VAVRTTEPTEIASGVWRIGTELVNWYLVEDGGRLTVVDAARRSTARSSTRRWRGSAGASATWPRSS